MPVQSFEPGANIGARRGEIVVCIRAQSPHQYFADCLRSVLAHTPSTVRILICDLSADRWSSGIVRALDASDVIEHEVLSLNLGETRNATEDVFAIGSAVAPADLIVLGSDCIVAEGWVEGLHEAAYADSTIATASPLSLSEGQVVVSESGLPPVALLKDRSFENAAAAVRHGAARLHPRILSADGHCAYLRRSALELLSDLQVAVSPVDSSDIDFSSQCRMNGLCHVVADSVLVRYAGVVGPPLRATRTVLADRLARSMSAARRALDGLSLVIDARVLAAEPMTGTQLHVLELIAALARTGGAHVKALVAPQLGTDAGEALIRLREVEMVVLTHGARRAPLSGTDIVHRPFQVSSTQDLLFLSQIGERLVVTQQDLISYHNPSYFSSFGEWEGYRDLTRKALAFADRVVFFSAHTREDALAEGLLEPRRANVVPIGVDHTSMRVQERPIRPSRAQHLPDEVNVMVCIGTDFRHKNRIFALRVLDELQSRHNWGGWLVLAGPRVAHGSSIPDEERLLASRPRLADAVLDVQAVSEAEKAWLLRRANLVLYPTVHEGFGLVPFEAADYGVPCLWAKGTSLSEVLPDAAAGIVPWDAATSADRAIELMRDAAAGAHNVQVVREAAAALKWDLTARRLLNVYHAACNEPPTPTGAVERNTLTRAGLTEDAMRLVGPDGALPRDLERPLLALATHRLVGLPAFAAIKAGYRASYRWRRGRPNRSTVDGPPYE